MRSRGPAFARPVGLRPGCPDREVDLLCSRTSVGPRRVRRLPALRAAAGLPQPARRSHRRPPPRPPGPSALRLPASPPPGCPDGPTFVVGVHRTPCPVPSPPRSPAASSSEVALRRTRWSCSVLSRCERAGPLTLRLPASSATGCPAACFAFLDCLPLRPARRRPGLPGRRRRSCLRWPTLVLGGPRRSSPGRSVGWSPNSPPSGVSSGWPAVSLGVRVAPRRAARSAGLPAPRRPEFPPAGPPSRSACASLLVGPLGRLVSQLPAVRSFLRLARRLALRWRSSMPVSARGTRGFGEVF